MNRIRLLLADDHAVLRTGLKLFINDQPDMICVGEAENGAQAIQRTIELQPDILLLDMGMPDKSGLDVLNRIKEGAPETRILVLTMYNDNRYLRKALSRGASGYVLKKAADQELLTAIRAVMRGEIYIHPSMTRALLDDMLPQEKGASRSETARPLLSKREEEVIIWVARGYTNQEVANHLVLSVKAVETYRARAMNKLGLKSRAELVRYALAHDWLEK